MGQDKTQNKVIAGMAFPRASVGELGSVDGDCMVMELSYPFFPLCVSGHSRASQPWGGGLPIIGMLSRC